MTGRSGQEQRRFMFLGLIYMLFMWNYKTVIVMLIVAFLERALFTCKFRLRSSETNVISQVGIRSVLP